MEKEVYIDSKVLKEIKKKMIIEAIWKSRKIFKRLKF